MESLNMPDAGSSFLTERPHAFASIVAIPSAGMKPRVASQQSVEEVLTLVAEAANMTGSNFGRNARHRREGSDTEHKQHRLDQRADAHDRTRLDRLRHW